MRISQELINRIKEKQIVLFGELHGTKEIPKLLEEVFSALAKEETFNIALEIPSRYQLTIDKFLLEGKEDYLIQSDFFLETVSSDGRNSLEYLNLIKKIYHLRKEYKRPINIFCIELDEVLNEESAQDQKEKELSKSIMTIAKKGHLLVVLGDIHAAKKIIKIGDQKIVPLGYVLSKKFFGKVMSVRFSPRKGSFFNRVEHTVEFNEENSRFDTFFDVVIPIPEVTPCSFVRS